MRWCEFSSTRTLRRALRLSHPLPPTSAPPGRGAARSKVFRHAHEQETGRTSSIAQHSLCFDVEGKVLNDTAFRSDVACAAVTDAAKIISLVDLAGHERYFKTTAFGLTGHLPGACAFFPVSIGRALAPSEGHAGAAAGTAAYRVWPARRLFLVGSVSPPPLSPPPPTLRPCADYACVLVAANAGLVGMVKEHLGIALALKLPAFFVITKIDMAPEHILKQTVQELTTVLKKPGVRKRPFIVRSDADVFTACRSIANDSVAPIFLASAVDGRGLNRLRLFLNVLQCRTEWGAKESKAAEFVIDDTFLVPGVGTVVAGTLKQGVIRENQKILLGPGIGDGLFTVTAVKSIHYKRMPVNQARGRGAALGLFCGLGRGGCNVIAAAYCRSARGLRKRNCCVVAGGGRPDGSDRSQESQAHRCSQGVGNGEQSLVPERARRIWIERAGRMGLG